MSDWRSKPRNGKAAFMTHVNAIQDALRKGATCVAIRTQLMESNGLDMSQAQFNRYVKTLLQAKPNISPSILRDTAKPPLPVESGVRKFAHNPTPADNLLD